MKNKLLITVGIILISCSAFAQTDEKGAMEQTIQAYFEGWMTGDTTLVGQAMHQTCHLKVYRNGEFFNIERNKYLNGFKPHSKELGVSARILSLDFTGNIGSAKCEIETPKFVFTDYFNLIKIEDKWMIVDKISTRKEK